MLPHALGCASSTVHPESGTRASHARYIPISHSLTRLRLLYSHSPPTPLPIPTLSAFGKVSWGGMPQTLLTNMLAQKNSCVGFARDAQLSEGSAVHRHHVHDGEQQFGPLQEARGRATPQHPRRRYVQAGVAVYLWA
eukprot:scaffold3143_cov104-Isochrysis_galbana.AAC.8